MPFSAADFHDGARFLILLTALVIEALAGGFGVIFRLLPHPVVIVGRAVQALERRLNRPERGERRRAQRGFLVLALLAATAASLGLAIEAYVLPARYGTVLAILLVAILLAARSLFDHVRRVAISLDKGGVEGGRKAVAHIVGRDVAALDAHGVARAAIESLAENFSDAVLGPALWYLLFGLPGLFVHKTVNTLDSMIGHRTERYLRFGAATAYADTALNFLPARLSALLFALAAACVPGGQPWRAIRVTLRDAHRHRSHNAGWPEASMAGALGLALAGPRRYGGQAVADAWMGEEFSARATSSDIRRALVLYGVAWLLLVALCLGGLIAMLVT